jgi:hypothetical protein
VHHAAVSLVAAATSRQLMTGISEIEALCARLFAMRASSTELVSLQMIHDAEEAGRLREPHDRLRALREGMTRELAVACSALMSTSEVDGLALELVANTSAAPSTSW